MRIILIIKEDIKLFPPVSTLMRALLDEGNKVEVIGNWSDCVSKRRFEAEGVNFHNPGNYDVEGNLIGKLINNIAFRRRVKSILYRLQLGREPYRLWIFQGKTICLLHRLVKYHPCILHPLEFVDREIKLYYRLLSPLYNAASTYGRAYRVVNCEYNRAHILKGLLNLDEMPVVLPNKMLVDQKTLDFSAPEDIKEIACEVAESVRGKRVILYQGIFVKGERRLEEFCKAVMDLGPGYVMIIMGSSSQEGYRLLQKEYSGSNIIFVPFIAPPYHLLVTRLAHIGILTYFPRSESIATVINPLYCAPNKIFEYGMHGIPMIGNDIPGLYYIFREFECGKTVDYPMTKDKIKTAIEDIFSDYETYSYGSRHYFESVDVHEIVKTILKDE